MNIGIGIGINQVRKAPAAGGFDADAQLFFDEYLITDATIKDAVDQLVLDHKTGQINASDIWVKRTQICPIVGGDATKNAGNLANPGSKELTFVNSPPHSSTGALFNGTTQYTLTDMIPSVDLADEDITLVIYLKNNNADNTFITYVDDGSNLLGFRRRTDGNIQTYYNDKAENRGVAGAAGMSTHVIRSTTSREFYNGSTSIDTQTDASAGALTATYEMPIMCSNITGTFANFKADELRFWGLYTGLTDDEVEDLDDAMTRFQTALSRQV